MHVDLDDVFNEKCCVHLQVVRVTQNMVSVRLCMEICISCGKTCI